MTEIPEKNEDKSVIKINNWILVIWVLLTFFAFEIFRIAKYYEYIVYTIGQFFLFLGILMLFARTQEKKYAIRIKFFALFLLCIGFGILLAGYLYYHGSGAFSAGVRNLEPYFFSLFLLFCGIALLYLPLKHMYCFLFKCRERVTAECKKVTVIPFARQYKHTVIYKYMYNGKYYTEESTYTSYREKHLGPKEGECFELLICARQPECFLHKKRGEDYFVYCVSGIVFVILSLTVFLCGGAAG